MAWLPSLLASRVCDKALSLLWLSISQSLINKPHIHTYMCVFGCMASAALYSSVLSKYNHLCSPHIIHHTGAQAYTLSSTQYDPSALQCGCGWALPHPHSHPQCGQCGQCGCGCGRVGHPLHLSTLSASPTPTPTPTPKPKPTPTPTRTRTHTQIPVLWLWLCQAFHFLI